MEDSGDKSDSSCINDESRKGNDSSECASPATASTPANTRNSSGLGSSNMTPSSSSSSETTRSTVKELIERYFYQLQRGCGDPFCTNETCASSGLLTPMTPNEAAAKALQLFSQDAPFCDRNNQLPKLLRSRISGQSTSSRTLPHHQNSDALTPNHCASNMTPTSTSRCNFPIGDLSWTNTRTNATRQSAGRTATNGHGVLDFLYDSDQVSANLSPDFNASEADSSRINTSGSNNRIFTYVYDSDSSPERQHRIRNIQNEPAALAANQNNLTNSAHNSGLTSDSSSVCRASGTPSLTSTGTTISGQAAAGRTTTNGVYLDFLHDSDPNVSANSSDFSVGETSVSQINTSNSNNRLREFLYDSDSSSERQNRTKNTETDPVAKENNSGDSTLYTRFPPVHFLNEQIIDELIEKGTKDGKYEQLLNAIAEVYSCVDKLSQSFRRTRNPVFNQLASSTTATKLQELLGKSPCDLKKEDLRSLEGETEKDEDSSCTAPPSMEVEEISTTTTAAAQPVPENVRDRDRDISMSDDSEDVEMPTVIALGSCKSSKDFIHLKNTSDMLVDLESLRRVKKKLFALNQSNIAETLNSNIVLLSETIKYQYNQWDWEQVLHCIIICFDMITNISNSLMDFEFLERSLPKLCQVVRVMPVVPQARLTRVWSVHCKDQLHSLVQCCQQLISLHVIMNDVAVQENSDVIAATKVLKIAYYASILAGESDPPRNPILNDLKEDSASTSLVMQHDDEDELFVFNTEQNSSQYPRYADDDLAKELNLRAMYCRNPVVPFDEFYNEPLSDNIQMDRDYLCYKRLSLDPSGEDSNFSYMLYSFILTPATKVVGLYYDSRIRMYSERHTSIYSILSLYNGEGNELNSTPDLKLKVRRDNIVNDALVGLELVAMSNPKDLKKQLVIEFVGEQGIDEGGVSKEFFQLIVEEIFNIDFGMFVELEETDAFWFNSMSFENDAQFTLIGIIIGLAIYNNIILAVRFPMVVYRKLMGAFGTFFDLKDFNPTLYRSLKSMLEYEDDDMEDVFMQTFKISYKTIFGDVVDHELTPGGADVFVGQSNKQDFVDLYADFLLNNSIERQFEAFKKGFEMVTDESPLRLLFRPEEIELLVCGSKKFDFVELEKSTEYEGGYTKDTEIIQDFWEIVHSMPEESKRKLLEFTTGSDRVPVGGLSRLKLLITRHGPDCDRLPTSHTCFNILLLPEYSSKEKLEERLLKAITYSKGFGML